MCGFVLSVDSGALKIAYDLITAAVTSGRISRISLEVYVVCAEAGVQVSARLGYISNGCVCCRFGPRIEEERQ